MSEEVTYEGRCFCGAVKFTVRAPTLWCAHCHCSMCQRIHGAGVVTWVGCEQDAVAVDAEHLRWYSSSAGAQRGACNCCGTHLFFRSGRWPGELHITRTSFRGALDREPAGHAFYNAHSEWLVIGDKLPRSDEEK